MSRGVREVALFVVYRKRHRMFWHPKLGWTPHPVIVTKGDNRDYIRVLLYSYETTIKGWGVLLTPNLQGKDPIKRRLITGSFTPELWRLCPCIVLCFAENFRNTNTLCLKGAELGFKCNSGLSLWFGLHESKYAVTCDLWHYKVMHTGS